MIYYVADYKIEGAERSTIQALCSHMRTHSSMVIDTETRRIGLSDLKNDIRDTEVTMLQIGNIYNQWTIDVRCLKEEDLSLLRKTLKSKSIVKVGFNIKYDYQVLKSLGITFDEVYDVMLGEYVRYTGLTQEKGFYSLQQTHYRYYGVDPYSDQLSLFDPYIPKANRSVVGAKDKFEYSDIFYGAMDIITTDKVYKAQKEYLASQGLLKTIELENQFVLVLGDMEMAGMPIDVDRWLELEEWSNIQLEKVLAKLKKLRPEVENWNSHIQVKRAFKELGIPIATREGKDSVQELVIKEHSKNFPIIDEYLKYKGFSKLISTYGRKFLKFVSPITGRVHSSFIQILNTGRTSSTSPNMQNIVSEKEDFPEGNWWREAFSAPEGRTLVVADYSSQELAVAAWLSQDEVMIDAIRHKKDLHKLAASVLYGKDVNKITKLERSNGKTFNFAVLYGASADKIAQAFKVSRVEAKRLIDNYFKTFVGLKKFQEETYTDTIKRGYILVDKLGRRSYLFDYHIYEFNKSKRLAAEYFRLNANYCIQGSAAAMAKRAGILLRKALKGTSAIICLLVHDEYIIECDEVEAPKIKQIIETCMQAASTEFCDGLSVAEAAITKNWKK